MSTVYNDLIRFSSYVKPINLAFNQYLLLASQPVLIHTGSIGIARELIAPLKAALAGKSLSYIFVSHFESDECGGLGVILAAFPEAKVLCSEVTARQLKGFGLLDEVFTKQDGEKIKTPDYELEFITYPSEMHLWDGLLLIENHRKILFSSDLVLRMGEVKEEVIESDIPTEIEHITHAQIPDEEKRQLLIEVLKKKDIDFIATGHGPCVKKG